MNLPRWLPAALATAAGVLLGVFALVVLTTDDADPAETIDDADPADSVATADAADSVATADPADTIATADAADTVDPGDPIDPADSIVDGQPVGFEVVTLRSVQPDGTVEEWCVWHADTTDQRAQGLQEVTSLGEPIGMAFSYDAPVDNAFHMHNTRMPLSIAWFGEGGRFVGATNMVPCDADDRSDCARYAPGVEYSLAVEVPRGELSTYGLIPDSTAELLDEPCP